jgi:hypothetical protein
MEKWRDTSACSDVVMDLNDKIALFNLRENAKLLRNFVITSRKTLDLLISHIFTRLFNFRIVCKHFRENAKMMFTKMRKRTFSIQPTLMAKDKCNV